MRIRYPMLKPNTGFAHTRKTPGSVRFGSAVYTLSEGASQVEIEIVRYGGSSLAASVRVISEDNTAVAGVDYVAVDEVVSWADGELGSKYITVLVNTVYGANISFFLNFDDFVVVSEGTPSTTEIILDAVPYGAVELQSASYSVDRGDDFSFGIRRTLPYEGNVTVNWSIDMPGALPLTGSQSWTDGDGATKTVNVQTPIDAVDSTITITLGATQGTQLGDVTEADVDVLVYTAGFSSPTYNESFGTAETTLTVVRGGSTNALSIRWTTDAGTTGILSWANGDVSSRTIALDVATETYNSNVFQVVLTRESGPPVINISPDTATVTMATTEFTSRLYSVYSIESVEANNASIGDMNSFSIDAESVGTTNASITSILLHATLTSYAHGLPEEINTANASISSIELNTILLVYMDGIPEEIETSNATITSIALTNQLISYDNAIPENIDTTNATITSIALT